LTTNIAQIAKNCARSDAQKALIGRILFMIENMQTIEAITREQYHDMTERFFDEFVDNGANEETVAKCMFIGLAFCKLELMLFGENEDGDSE
jgi:hypothetical protein